MTTLNICAAIVVALLIGGLATGCLTWPRVDQVMTASEAQR
jgi:hypothetical protein